MVKKIKLFDPLIDSSENKIISKVLKNKLCTSGSGMGNVSKFEIKIHQIIFEQTFKNYLEKNSQIFSNIVFQIYTILSIVLSSKK